MHARQESLLPEASSISFKRSVKYGLGVLWTSLKFRHAEGWAWEGLGFSTQERTRATARVLPGVAQTPEAPECLKGPPAADELRCQQGVEENATERDQVPQPVPAEQLRHHHVKRKHRQQITRRANREIIAENHDPTQSEVERVNGSKSERRHNNGAGPHNEGDQHPAAINDPLRRLGVKDCMCQVPLTEGNGDRRNAPQCVRCTSRKCKAFPY